jgi:hypothetical protein
VLRLRWVIINLITTKKFISMPLKETVRKTLKHVLSFSAREEILDMDDVKTYIERMLHVCWELNGKLESKYFLNGVE